MSAVFRGGFLCVEEVSTGAFALNGVVDDPCWFSSSHHASLFLSTQLLRIVVRPRASFVFVLLFNSKFSER